MRIRNLKLIATLFICITVMVVVSMMAYRTADAWENSAGLRVDSVENAINTAIVQCYALEGEYPPSIHYLSEYYGIIIDERLYYYHYEFVGSNIRPNVWVVRR